MATSSEHKLRCPYCGGNPVVYDPQFSEYVCPHCGAVLDDRPILDVASEERVNDEHKHIGTHVYSRKHFKLVFRHMQVVYTKKYVLARMALRELRKICSRLGVPMQLCSSAEPRVVSAVERFFTSGKSLQGKYHGKRDVAERIALLSLYLTCREHNYALSMRDIHEKLGIPPNIVYSWLYEYRDILGYKYTDTRALYLVRVLKALSKQLTPDQTENVARLTRELLEKYPVATGRPVHTTLTYALVACRMLGVRVCVNSLASELGVSDYVYSRARRLYSLIKRLEKREKK
jgi:transcription initiation factor TFIIIB Brf1 subunit/transcription initiation factor TFIIB